jgi:hypothetical protein
VKSEQPTPGELRHKQRPRLTIPEELGRIITLYQARECIPTRSEAILSLVREGAKRVGLMGGQQK